jgi:hypothetical protein
VSTTVGVELPSGRAVALRPVGDEDEAFIFATAGSAAPGARATALVARCLTPAGDDGALTVGDRDAALLHLRRLTLGEPIDCVLPCPGCGESLEWRIQVSDLLAESAAHAAGPHTVNVDDAGTRYCVSFRLPAAAEVDRIAAHASDRITDAAQLLFDACVITAERDGEACTPADLPAAVRAAVEAAMADADPQAEVQLRMQCPSCDAEFASLFDTAAFFLRELDARATRILHDVHLLALHYHWSEADILRLPPRRRAQYIELVRDAVTRGRAR